MRRYLTRFAVLVGTGTLIVPLVLGTASRPVAAATPGDGAFSAQGVVVSSSSTAPNVPGATGSFVLGSLSGVSGNISGAEDSNGDVTIYTWAGSTFWQCDSTGNNCVKSTQAAVVTQGARLFVTGQSYGTGSAEQLFLSNAFNPTAAPPASTSAPVPNPKPSTLRDYTFGDVFGVVGKVEFTWTPLEGATLLGSAMWGFVM